jgi:putative PIG3 family NAD(P)H quinone oxidoreductase
MRAIVVTEPGGPEVLKVQDIPEPECGPDDVLVDVKATALNRADLAQRRGRYPAPVGIRQDVPGLEMAGVVASVGNRVTDVRVGDRVCGLLGGGGYAERVATHSRMVIPIPSDMTFAQAASIPEVFFTAYDALVGQAGLQLGESVLIHAVGSGVGTAAVQLARTIGAFSYGTAGSGQKLKKAEALGLDVGINYREQDFAAVVREHTGGRGVDVVLDVIGATYWDSNVASLSTLGRLVLVATMGGTKHEVNLSALMGKRLRVFGTVLRARPIEEKISLTQEFRRHVMPLFLTRQLEPVVDCVFPFEDAPKAHQYMEENLNFGKIVLSLE